MGERTSRSERRKKHAGRSEETQDPKVWTLEKTRREYGMVLASIEGETEAPMKLRPYGKLRRYTNLFIIIYCYEIKRKTKNGMDGKHHYLGRRGGEGSWKCPEKEVYGLIEGRMTPYIHRLQTLASARRDIILSVSVPTSLAYRMQ